MEASKEMPATSIAQTPLPIIAQVSRVITQSVDRITGDRSDTPLMTAMGIRLALQKYQIRSQVMYGQAAWIEVLANHELIWAGCWGKNFWFWVVTEYGETIDLSTAVTFRKRAHDRPEIQSLYSPPLLWSREIPSFYRYLPEGVAELDLTQEHDRNHWERLKSILQDLPPLDLAAVRDETAVDATSFPNEAMLLPGRRVLDDSKQSFRHFDRALSVGEMPPSPFQ